MHNHFFFRYTRLISARPALTILLLVLFSATLGLGTRHVVLDNDLRQFFSAESSDAKFLEKHQAIFGTDETALLLLLDARNSNSAALLSLVEALSDKLGSVEGVERIDSIVDSSILYSSEDDLVISPAFGQDSQLEGTFAKRLELFHAASMGGERLIDAQGLLTVMIVDLAPEYRDVQLLAPPIKAVQAIVNRVLEASSSNIGVYYGGVPFTRHGAISSMMKDMYRLIPTTGIIIALFLFGMFRRKHAVVLPMVAIFLSAVCTLGVLGYLDISLDPLSISFPILLLVIAVADGIHFLARYHEERLAGAGYGKAVLMAGGRIGMACFLTSATTAIGFASLLFTNMTILRSFGLVVSIGVCFAFFIVITLLPAGIAASKSPPVKPAALVVSVISNLIEWMLQGRRPVYIAVFGVVLAIGSVWFAAGAKVDNFIAHSLPDDHEVTKGNYKIDELMAGIVPIEYSFVGEEGDFKDPDILRRMEKVLKRAESAGFNGMTALPTLLRELNRTIGDTDALPTSRALNSQLLLLVEGSSDAGLERLVNEDYSHARAFGSGPDRGAMGFIELRKKLEADLDETFAGTTVKGYVTGVATVAASAFTDLVKELLLSLLAALLVIMVVVACVFRSVKMSLAGMLSNTLPLLLGMAWFGISDAYLNPAPAVVFCVALGIAVDDTIHVLARYREELTRARTYKEAICNSVQHSMSAIAITSFILAAGFAILGMSSFPSNQQFGVLGAIIILLALVTDLIFTPVCLYLLKPGQLGGEGDRALD